jgi:hypothetical protein
MISILLCYVRLRTDELFDAVAESLSARTLLFIAF